jgi:hypothetical protein
LRIPFLVLREGHINEFIDHRRIAIGRLSRTLMGKQTDGCVTALKTPTVSLRSMSAEDSPPSHGGSLAIGFEASAASECLALPISNRTHFDPTLESRF